jgi:Domain of unknown function (DUF5615)
VRWLIDECADAALAAFVHGAGHDVVYMSDVAPRAADHEVMSRADRESRLLLTEDKDFGDLGGEGAIWIIGDAAAISATLWSATPTCWLGPIEHR